MTKNSFAYIFPGQGAQYVGMGKEFFDSFAEARHVVEQAEDTLHTPLKKTLFEGPESLLKETRHCQVAMFVTSLSILNVLKTKFHFPAPLATGGLSLGEYTALVASEKLSFDAGVKLVSERSRLMHEACEKNPGTMAVVLGLSDEVVEDIVSSLRLPSEVSCANFNCPGQVVLSGTHKGIETAKTALLTKGAKRILALEVHGAFHSMLMTSAEKELTRLIEETPFNDSAIPVAMNVTGRCTSSLSDIKKLLVQQLTSSVRWSSCVQAIDSLHPTHFLEIGCGTTLQGMNKRIGPKALTYSIEKPKDIEPLLEILS